MQRAHSPTYKGQRNVYTLCQVDKLWFMGSYNSCTSKG